MADLEFDVAKRAKKKITFTLGGEDHVYSFTPPKNAVMLMPVIDPAEGKDMELAITASTFDWLGEGLSETDRKRIVDRLKDKDDDLDSEVLSDVISKLSEKVAGRPTT